MKIKTTFFNSELEFRVRLFNLLAMAGTLISLLMAIGSLFTSEGLYMSLINLALSALSFALLYYSYSSRKYQLCYLITIVFIFFLGFAFLFFSGGGYRSGLPSFFIFGMVFTVFMLEGPLMIAVSAAELLFYTGLCIYGYHFPQSVVWYETEEIFLTDLIIGFVSVSLALGFTMYLSFRMYKIQQLQLEKARGEAEKAAAAKSIFLANMSHEIRTPISIMLGMNEMILREKPPAAVSGFVARSQDAGQLLLSLVDDILDVSRIESGKMSLIEQAYSPADLVSRLTQTGREQAQRRGLSFFVRCSGLPDALYGDFLHLRQIALNFITNAVKYTASGSVTLSVSAPPLPSGEGVLLKISVSDTGPGIKKEQLEKIFEPFTRGEAAKSGGIDGTGLGLAIARSLSLLMGGNLSVESEYGRGSTFTAEIPQRFAEKAEGTKAPEQEQGFLAPSGKVLLVDDNEGHLELVKSLLSRSLLHVETAKSGREALLKAAETDFHVIITDYMMPDMDGAQTLSRLRQAGCLAPVVSMTADVTEKTRETLLGAGFAECLTKPVPYARLDAVLIRLLPAELVTPIRFEAVHPGDTEEKELSSQLSEYGVCLEDSLGFLGHELSQYKSAAALFLAHTSETASRLSVLAEKEDFSALSHAAHSLKTFARTIGAGELSELSARLEEKCRGSSPGRGAYVMACLPLLLYQLGLTRTGMARIADETFESGALRPSPDGSDAFPSLMAEARGHIAAYHFIESLKALSALLELEQAPAYRRLLESARSAVESLSFEEAEAQLSQLFKEYREVPVK